MVLLLLPLPIAAVPMELFSCCRWSARLEKSSQKSRLLSSMGTALYPPAEGPSTNREKPWCAVLAPACAVFATFPAATLACAARSDSASYDMVSCRQDHVGLSSEHTCLAVGCMKSLLTVLAVFVTVEANQPKPLVNAATGSF